MWLIGLKDLDGNDYAIEVYEGNANVYPDMVIGKLKKLTEDEKKEFLKKDKL